MLAPVRVTPASDPAVSLEEAKDHLRVGHDDEDTLITACIAAATDHVERLIGQALVTQTWAQSFPCFDWRMRLRPGPVQSIESVTYLDTDGAEQTLDAGDYRLLFDAEGAFVDRQPGGNWPSTQWRDDAVTVQFVAGVDPEDVSPSLRAAVLLIVGDLYANREGQQIEAAYHGNPTVDRLLNYVRPRVGV